MTASMLASALLLLITQNAEPYQLQEGAFSIRFPRKPARRTILLPTSEGRKLPAVTFRVEHHFLDFYLVYHECAGDVDPARARVVLQTARDSLVSQLGGTLITSREVAIEGATALEFEVEYLDPQGLRKRVRERSCLTDERFYQVMVFGSPLAMRSEAGSEFLQSFSLKRPRTKKGNGEKE
jgi:hypothetical protein